MAFLLGTFGNDAIIGTLSDDIIVTGAGANAVNGGDGDDLVFAGSGNDTVDGGNGDDWLFLDGGDDVADGGDGDDAIFAGSGDDEITGGAGNDLIDGGYGFDIANFVGAAQNYTFASFAGVVVVTDRTTGFRDVVVHVELLRFDNAEFVLDGSNNTPIANDIATDVHEDGPAVAGNLLADSAAFDFEGDTVSIVAVNGDVAAVGDQIALASGALLTVGADGDYSYDPNGMFEALNTGDTGTDTATFEISDGADTITRTITFAIQGEDDNVAPVANDVLIEVDEDSAGASAYFFDAADADADDDPTTLQYHATDMQEPPFFSQFPNPTTDFLNEVVGGRFFVDPGLDLQALTQGEIKEYTFAYTATDSQGLESNEATLTFRVIGENDAPSRPGGVSFGLFAPVDTGLVTLSYGVIDLDVDDTGASLAYDIHPTTGFTIIDNGDGGYSVDTDDPVFDHLAEGQVLGITFTFDAIDSHGASTQFTNNNLALFGVNDAPVAAADSFMTDEDTPIVGSLFADNGAGEDSDVDDGDTFHLIAVNDTLIGAEQQITLASGALLTVAADGTFFYDPNGAFDDLELDETATDSFTYTIEDQFTGMSTADVEIAVAGLSEVATLDSGLF